MCSYYPEDGTGHHHGECDHDELVVDQSPSLIVAFADAGDGGSKSSPHEEDVGDGDTILCVITEPGY